MHYRQSNHVKFILGSGSSARKKVLSQLGILFNVISPDIEEKIKKDESVAENTSRLAREKADAVKNQINYEALILSGDQVLSCEDMIYGKPLTADIAKNQLRNFSNKNATFVTSICLLDTRNNNYQVDTVETKISFRELSDEEISNYIEREKPFQCAGSFKSEGLGMALITSVTSEDPHAILGIPLVKLNNMFRNVGFNCLTDNC